MRCKGLLPLTLAPLLFLRENKYMRLVGSDKGLQQVEVGNKVINRSKDGTFNVSGAEATLLKKSGDFAVAGITFRNASGYVCQDCTFVGLYRDKCGKCGSTNLIPEEQNND